MFIFYFSIFNLFHFFIFLIVSNSLYISREYKYRYIKLYIHKKHVRFIICFLSLTFICVSLIVISILIGFVRNVNCELCEGESYFVLITEDGFNQTQNMPQTITLFIKTNFFIYFFYFQFLNYTRLKRRIVNWGFYFLYLDNLRKGATLMLTLVAISNWCASTYMMSRERKKGSFFRKKGA